jgi:MFS family permease
MDASAPAITREGEVRSKIRKVSTFSRIARVVCAALFGFGLVGSVLVLLFGVLGAIFFPVPSGGIGFTLAQKIWMLPVACAAFGVGLAIVYQLYLLFGSLAAGAIYTFENVRRVRHVGLLSLLWAVLGVLIPVAWSALVALGFIAPSSPSKFEAWFSWSQSLSSFLAAALILLVSWIMDVGLYEKDQADALQRDADLVI